MLKKEIQRLSESYNLSFKEVECIINSQFKFFIEVNNKGDLKGVKLKYLGKFACKPYKVLKTLENINPNELSRYKYRRFRKKMKLDKEYKRYNDYLKQKEKDGIRDNAQ